MNMATQLMSDPNMQNLMGGLMSGAMPAANNNAPESSEGGAAGGGGLEALLQAGQQIAAQMQASNPDLVNQLRNVMTVNPNAPNPDENPNPDGSEDKKD
ncbi:unnamed protein product [Oppiella nova]|uniref:Uncharacterized protein n=1 Tax=Oppiella nova TaxID=334625 RepID=A0A7R9MJS5_9ACAR|nr:unnamed protein product [Oppiella nova]CAG2178596.1 unnamed protein product [Oppiella nova]